MRILFKNIVVWIITLEARAVLRKYKPRIVAITGSVGKTSTKDAIYEVLAQGARTRKSEKSFNSEIGLPLTILGAPNAWGNPLRWIQNIIDGLFLIFFTMQYPEWLVLEVGADRPGDIRSLSKWLPVDMAVITRLPEVPVHVEFFDSAEAVIEEKAALIDAIKPGGVLALFADDSRTLNLQRRLPAPDAKIITFGFANQAEVRGEQLSIVREEGNSLSKAGRPIGIAAKIFYEGTGVPLEIIGAVGVHAFIPALAASAVGVSLGKPLRDIVGALERYDPPAGRMRLLQGIKNTVIIDDTYNASPAATEAALDTLALLKDKSATQGVSSSLDIPRGAVSEHSIPRGASSERGIPQGRLMAILGDMLELGRVSVEEHRKIGAYLVGKVDILITIGFRAHDIAQGALDKGMPEQHILQFEDAHKAGNELQNLLQEGDYVLVKGSQSIRTERVVEGIMAEPGRAAELLVRQDEEWKKR